MGIINIVCFYYFYWITEDFFEKDRVSVFPIKENRLLTNFTYNSGQPVLLKITGYSPLSLKNEMRKLWE